MMYADIGLFGSKFCLGFFDLENDKKIESFNLNEYDKVNLCLGLIKEDVLICLTVGKVYAIKC